MIENRVPDAGATRVVPHNGQYTPFPYSAIPLDLRGMRGAMGANYAESLYLKEANAHAQHQLVRPLPSAGKVTSSYRTYDQSPINLVQKEAPPAPDNFNYYSLQSAYLNAHPPYTPYPIPFNNPYLPVPGTPTKSAMKFMDTAPPILTVPSSPVKTSVDVKNAPPQFKVPLKTRPTPYSRPKRNSGPPPIPVPRPVEETYPEIANILANSKDIPESEDELKRFHKGSCVWSQVGIKNVSVSEEELKFFIERDLARRVEQSTEDFIVSGVSNSSQYNLYLRTVVAIRENKESGKVILTLMCEKGDKVSSAPGSDSFINLRVGMYCKCFVDDDEGDSHAYASQAPTSSSWWHKCRFLLRDYESLIS